MKEPKVVSRRIKYRHTDNNGKVHGGGDVMIPALTDLQARVDDLTTLAANADINVDLSEITAAIQAKIAWFNE